jgi:alkanesulfonate monooxygenase SsuD/methylene tetrahydromethanopterin reductase-like flavin-dependent oxidoreductase (luciferase family)
MMKFSIIYEAQMADTSRQNEQQVFRDIVEQSIYAEEMGFDTIWAVEHTALTQYAHMSAPETFLAYLAGRTSRIGIGHGVVCLPPAMNHPVKVAERIATPDRMSSVAIISAWARAERSRKRALSAITCKTCRR